MDKGKLFFTAVLALLLVLSIYCADAIPNARALQPTTEQKGLSILDSVVNFDITKYDIEIKDYPQDLYFGSIPQEDVEYTLTSSTSNLKLLCTFIDGSMSILDVVDRQGVPFLTKSTSDTVEMAKDFLTNYQRYTGDSFYGELSSMLETSVADKNMTLLRGTTRLEIIISGDYTTYSWSYVFNGINATSKCVSIGFKNGFLKDFIDTWNIYQIGSENVSLSEEEAVSIAIEQAKNFKWDVVLENGTYEISNFKVTGAVIEQ